MSKVILHNTDDLKLVLVTFITVCTSTFTGSLMASQQRWCNQSSSTCDDKFFCEFNISRCEPCSLVCDKGRGTPKECCKNCPGDTITRYFIDSTIAFHGHPHILCAKHKYF